MKKSLWQKYNNLKGFESINENKKTDVLIIGAGLTGTTLAYNLINSNMNVILIDMKKCFDDTIAKSTGKIAYLQELKYQDIISVYDFDVAKLYYEAQKDAIKIINKNIKENNIDCDIEKVTNITFTCDEKEVPKFDKEQEFFDKVGVKYTSDVNILKNDEIKRLIAVKDNYVFNPVKYLISLMTKIKESNNIEVFENSIATKIKNEKDGYIVYVNDYKVHTKKIVLACNYPFFTIPGFVPLKTYLERSYLTAGKVLDNKKLAGITSNYSIKSFRYYTDDKKDNYFVYLANSSKSCDKLNYKKNYDDASSEFKNITNKEPNYKWTNMDVMTNDYMPLIGRVSEENKNVFIATGYNTWGITNGTIAAKILFDLLMNKKNKYEKVFSPTRSQNLPKIKNFIVNTLSSNTKAYALNLIKKNPSWYKNKAVVKCINGKRVGIYYDEDGKEHIVSNICPHLKCFLTFNEVDKTWDCPCHASRFDIDGNVLRGPACYNIKIDETK